MHELYQAILMDHYRSPRNRGTLESADFSSGVVNPSCGDAITIQGQVDHTTLTKLCFQGTGCVISQAAASLLCEQATGKELKIIERFTKDDVVQLLGISVGPTRLRCALLSLEALHKGLSQYAQSDKST